MILILVFQAADSEDLVILAGTVFDWSTRVMDGWTDRQTELWRLRCPTAVAAVAHKKHHKILTSREQEKNITADCKLAKNRTVIITIKSL